MLIVGATMAASLAAALAARALFDVRQLAADTNLTTAVYETLGTIYAILLAFVVSGVWQNFSKAQTTVHAEADALMGLMHIIEPLPDEHTQEIFRAVHSYAQMVIEVEWHELVRISQGYLVAYDLSLKSGPDTATALINAINSLEPSSPRDIAIFEQALVKLNTWLDARRERIQSAGGGNAAALWPLLITGALVLFAFHGLFAAQSKEVWTALLLGTSLVVGLAFYLIFTLDSPFTGTLSPHIGPFKWVINWCKLEEPLNPREPDI